MMQPPRLSYTLVGFSPHIPVESVWFRDAELRAAFEGLVADNAAFMEVFPSSQVVGGFWCVDRDEFMRWVSGNS